MDTLQDAYKDSEEEREENQPQNEQQSLPPEVAESPSEQIPELLTSEPEPETKAEPVPDPMPIESAENEAGAKVEPDTSNPSVTDLPSSEPDPESLPEPIPEPMAVQSAEEEPPKNEAGAKVEPLAEPLGSEDVSSDSISEDDQTLEMVQTEIEISDKRLDIEQEEPEPEGQEPSPKKHKSVLDVDPSSEFPPPEAAAPVSNGSKKSSKKKSHKGNNVWTKSTSRKGKKKAKNNNNNNSNHNNNNSNNNHIASKPEDSVFVAPVPRFPDKNDDTLDGNICLSKVYKAEKVELSDDRLSAGSCKGYRMVRATRGVAEGAWYFEIKLVHLGESGHTRLGWSTEKGDLQAPVGYDGNSFGYRDIDGSKIHKALRQKYGEEGFKEGDVIGFYINLPNGDSYAPKGPHLVWYKGQKYVCAPDPKEDPPKIVPGSEMSFFKNGVCQGVAFKDLYGGRYYPAASMYTLPNQPNCVVKFNFGPDFDCFPVDFGERPTPKSMIEVPYHGFDNPVENGVDEKQ